LIGEGADFWTELERILEALQGLFLARDEGRVRFFSDKKIFYVFRWVKVNYQTRISKNSYVIRRSTFLYWFGIFFSQCKIDFC
jgi:hypothetical protein